MSSATVILVGNLGRDPETKAAGQSTVTKFSIATSTREKDSDGNWTDRTTWWNVEVWGKPGENCARFLSKGKGVQVIGDVDLRPFTRADGTVGVSNDVKNAKVTFLSGGKADGAGADRSERTNGGSATNGQPGWQGAGAPDEDLPY